MEIESWKNILLDYINKYEKISEFELKSIILNDNTLLNCVTNFYNPPNLNDIVILYNEHLWFIKKFLSIRNIICVPQIEGIQHNKIQFESVNINNKINNNIQLSYLIFSDIIDPLYELQIISNKYNIIYNVKNIIIKCIIDSRTNEYKYPHKLSIESRAGLTVNCVIKKM